MSKEPRRRSPKAKRAGEGNPTTHATTKQFTRGHQSPSLQSSTPRTPPTRKPSDISPLSKLATISASLKKIFEAEMETQESIFAILKELKGSLEVKIERMVNRGEGIEAEEKWWKALSGMMERSREILRTAREIGRDLVFDDVPSDGMGEKESEEVDTEMSDVPSNADSSAGAANKKSTSIKSNKRRNADTANFVLDGRVTKISKTRPNKPNESSRTIKRMKQEIASSAKNAQEIPSKPLTGEKIKEETIPVSAAPAVDFKAVEAQLKAEVEAGLQRQAEAAEEEEKSKGLKDKKKRKRSSVGGEGIVEVKKSRSEEPAHFHAEDGVSRKDAKRKATVVGDPAKSYTAVQVAKKRKKVV